MENDLRDEELIVFPSELGWIVLRMRGAVVRQLSFGHGSAIAAIRAIAPGRGGCVKRTGGELVERLQRFAEGVPVDFYDLPVDTSHATEFHARVLNACREIPYGQTLTYGALAAKAGAPGAARAVGNCMAGNCVPLIIPCHRVVRAGGDIGRYSAAGGSATKRRLLKMEAAKCALSPRTFVPSGRRDVPISRPPSTNARHLG